MKGQDCKLPIQEDHKSFVDKQKIVNYSRGKKVGIIAAFLLLIAMSLMIVFTFQSINGINELKQEVDYLKASIQLLQKQINDENIYRDDSKTITTTNLPKVGNYDDYSGDVSDESYDYTEEDYENDDYDTYNYAADYNDSNVALTGEKFTKDAKTATVAPRMKRSILGHPPDDTAINSEEYEGRRRNSTNKKNHQLSTSPPPSSYSELKTHEEHTTPQPKQIHSRKIRVYHNTHAVKTTPQLKSGESRTTEENPDVEFTVVGTEQVAGRRTRHRQRRLELDDRRVITGRMHPLPTAHFSGDTSKYVLGQHDNFNGNGHLRHPQRIFVDWAESSWFHALGMDRHFSLSDGLLTIKESGLYFIYAQIYYYDEHDINGFRVYRNENETLLQCTTMTHSADRVMKGNTCFTAAAEYLNENDRISLGDLSESRYSLFEPGKSFFGVIKLGDVKIK